MHISLWVVAINQNIVQIYYIDRVNESSQRLINIGLEGRRSIGKPKRHHQILKMAVFGTKSGLLLVSCAYSNTIVYVFQV